MKKNNHGFGIAMLAVALIAVVLTLIINAQSIDDSDIETTAEATNAPVVTAQAFDESVYAYDVCYDDCNIFVSITNFGGVESVNVRRVPTTNGNDALGRIAANSSFVAHTMYKADDFYGFKTSEMSSCENIKFYLDSDGIVWINKMYLHVERSDYPENLDKQDYEMIVRYENGTYQVCISGNPNVRSAPTTGAYNSYGEFAGGSFMTTTIYRNTTWKFFGFKVEDFLKSGFSGVLGNIEADPDGIVWISTDYIDVYQG